MKWVDTMIVLMTWVDTMIVLMTWVDTMIVLMTWVDTMIVLMTWVDTMIVLMTWVDTMIVLMTWVDTMIVLMTWVDTMIVLMTWVVGSWCCGSPDQLCKRGGTGPVVCKNCQTREKPAEGTCANRGVACEFCDLRDRVLCCCVRTPCVSVSVIVSNDASHLHDSVAVLCPWHARVSGTVTSNDVTCLWDRDQQ